MSSRNKAYHKAELLLRNYRVAVWSLEDKVHELDDRCYELGSKRLEEYVNFLDDYDPNTKKMDFEEKLCYIRESKWLVELVDKALTKLKSYPRYGEDYFNIIYKQYIGKEENCEEDIINAVKMSRTTYYTRKKEAINIFSVILWGYGCDLTKENAN